MLKTLLRLLLYVLFLGGSTLLLLELSYRYYWVDFYGGTLTGLNSAADLETDGERPSVLVLGDSFSADQNSYVGQLRDSFPAYRIINSAIPGTTVRQHRIIAQQRIDRFDPDILLYQIYVGNDLFEYQHPITGGELSFARRCYWWLADRLLILGYLNARLPQLKESLGENPNPGLLAKVRSEYAVDKYNQRTKIQFKAAPAYLEETVLLRGVQADIFAAYITELEELLDGVKDDVQVVVMVLPHCVQLGAPYVKRMRELGAEISNPVAIQQLNFPFFTQLKSQLLDREIHYINGLKYLRRAHAQDTVLYYPNDPHLNTEGQNVLVHALISILRE